MNSAHAAECLLCHAAEAEEVARIRFDDVWRRYETDWGVVFDSEVRRRHAPSPVMSLLQCASCGLQWFDGAVPGDQDFYETLMAQTPYVAERWDFNAAAKTLRSGDAVADFGCGEGAFLSRVRPIVSRAVGVDLNRAAVEQLTARGFEGHAMPFADFAASARATFDVVCSFQVLEHMEHPEELVEPMISAVRSGGRLLLAVPNRDRVLADPTAPFDCPPHHLTRWSPRQFAALAERFRLDLLRVSTEPPQRSDAVDALLARTGVGSEPSRSLGRRALRAGAGRILLCERRHLLAERTGIYRRRSLRGHSLLAEMRRP